MYARIAIDPASGMNLLEGQCDLVTFTSDGVRKSRVPPCSAAPA